MTKKNRKRSKFMTAVFAAAMMFAQPAQADVTVNDESSLESALQSSDPTMSRIILGNDINTTSQLDIYSGKTLIGGDVKNQNTLTFGNNMTSIMGDGEGSVNFEYINFKKANFLVQHDAILNSLNCIYDGSENTQTLSLFLMGDGYGGSSFKSLGNNTFSNFTIS